MSLAAEAGKAATALSQLENSTVDKTAQVLRKHILKLQHLATSQWIISFGDLDAVADDRHKLAKLVEALKAHLSDAPTDVAKVLREAVSEAHSLGIEHAKAVVPAHVRVPGINTAPDITKAIETGPARVGDRLEEAARLLGRLAVGDSYSDLLPAIGVANQAVTSMSMSATYVINAASNDAVSAVAAAAGKGLVFVSERDGCLDCNAFAGHTSDDGFDTPPIHPNCRCQLQPWSSDMDDPNSISYPDGLKREAERSIARGFSSSDSNVAKVRAADKLLTQGTNLPASVQAYAARAVRKGTFPPVPREVKK